MLTMEYEVVKRCSMFLFNCHNRYLRSVYMYKCIYMQLYHIIPVLSLVWWFLVPKKQKTSNHMQHMLFGLNWSMGKKTCKILLGGPYLWLGQKDWRLHFAGVGWGSLRGPIAAMTWPRGPQVKFPVLQSHSFDPYAACLHWEHQECPQNSKSQGLEPPELGIWRIFWGEYFVFQFFLGGVVFNLLFVFYVFFPLVFLVG